jgi:DNA (cytosine-5)-methyltransferase 1
VRILDLFCGAGGAGWGYHLAGFEVVGVDVEFQSHYPFPVVTCDALEYLGSLSRCGYSPGDLGFDAVHASPPCQRFSSLNHVHKKEYVDLVEPTRKLLQATGLPYVIENVPGAPLLNPVRVCGTAVGLPLVKCRDGMTRQVRRHRLFETNFPVMVPDCNHTVEALGVYGNGPWNNNDKSRRRGGYQGTSEERRLGMVVPWMNRDEAAQAVPPAYTELVGAQLASHVTDQRKAPDLSGAQ